MPAVVTALLLGRFPCIKIAGALEGVPLRWVRAPVANWWPGLRGRGSRAIWLPVWCFARIPAGAIGTGGGHPQTMPVPIDAIPCIRLPAMLMPERHGPLTTPTGSLHMGWRPNSIVLAREAIALRVMGV